MTGLIYVIQATTTGFVKIGYSKKPPQRMRGLQTASPFKLKILAEWPGTKAIERRMHKILDRHRGEGEWFSAPLDVIENALREAKGEIALSNESTARDGIPRGLLLHFETALSCARKARASDSLDEARKLGAVIVKELAQATRKIERYRAKAA